MGQVRVHRWFAAPVAGPDLHRGAVAGGARAQFRRPHCCLAPPLQDQMMIFVPFAVPAPFASRHNPDWTPVIVPSAFTFHCWLLWPLQSQMIAAVPLAVPFPDASRHLLPYTVSCLADVAVHRWPEPPAQSYSCACVPLVVLAFGTSRQRPDWFPTISTFCRSGVPEDWMPAAAITAWAAAGQLLLVTVVLLE